MKYGKARAIVESAIEAILSEAKPPEEMTPYHPDNTDPRVSPSTRPYQIPSVTYPDPGKPKPKPTNKPTIRPSYAVPPKTPRDMPKGPRF